MITISEKRRDNKNRILRNGEFQQKDGRYRFTFKDKNNKRRYIYSWRLDKNDPTPVGKNREPSLREKERRVEQEMFSEVAWQGGNYTVLELCEKYCSLKTGVRTSTKTGYNTVLNFLRKDGMGRRRIDTVRISDAKEWLIKLQQVDGKSYSSIHTIRGVLRPAFRMAVEDDLIRKNPFDFELVSVVVNDSVTREAITRKQERDYLKFVREDRHFSKYYDAIYILFNTGLRISEFCGLTKSDLDFKENLIRVERQLKRASDMRYYIEKPKTDKGQRFIPMSPEVAECFRNVLANRPKVKIEPMVDGVSGFLCLDKNGRPMIALHLEKYMQHIREKYNKIYRIQMPEITPHVCRHTFCSKMARSGMNPKMLQYIMGHSDISVTLNTYTHVTVEDAKNEFYRVSSL